jgi:hypothetical protein
MVWEKTNQPVFLEFFPLGEDPWKKGFLQCLDIEAPLAKVVAIVDDMPAYTSIFKDLLKSEIRDRQSSSDFNLFSETHIPVPLIANDRTTIHYHVTRARDWVLYDFELVASNHLKAYAGNQLVTSVGPNLTKYCELDLQEPENGASRMIPAKKFWQENAAGNIQSDWAFKLRAEQASAPSEKILKDSDAFADSLGEKIGTSFTQPTSAAALLAKINPTMPNPAGSINSPKGPAFSTAKPKQSGPKSDPSP